MAGNSKPRKKYKPKLIVSNPLAHALNHFKTLDRDYLLQECIRHHDCLTAIVQGKGVYRDWGVLCGVFNMSLIMAEAGVGGEHLELVRQAQIAHTFCGRRNLKVGHFGYTGEELGIVKAVLDLYEEQLKIVTLKEFDRASIELEDRIKAGKIDFRVVDKANKPLTLKSI